MNVCELGEFGLIERLARIVDESGAVGQPISDRIVGIGDDAAAWKSRGLVQLGTADILIQDVHFTLEAGVWHNLGWKALAVNISDIAAMGGIPDYAMISLGLPPDTEVEDVAELYSGMAEIAHQFNVGIAGGDISGAPLLIISPTVIGTVEKDRMLTRSGAMPGDQIAVTGHLGSSAAGLRLIEEKPELDPQVASVLIAAHLRPSPRVSEGRLLGESGVKSAIDISDGLIADLAHICRASGVEARVHLADIPIHPAVKAAFGEGAISLALSGGEDYELLFTAPGEIIERMKQRFLIPVTVIGEITGGESGKVTILGETGREVEWEKRGWEHFSPPSPGGREVEGGGFTLT